MKVYKIRHKDTGLFSTGGMQPRWTKHGGKNWNKINYVHSHINQLKTDYTPADIYSRAEIVEAEITETLVHVEDAKDHLNKVYDDIIKHNEARIESGDASDYAYRGLNRAKARKAELNEKANI